MEHIDTSAMTWEAVVETLEAVEPGAIAVVRHPGQDGPETHAVVRLEDGWVGPDLVTLASGDIADGEPTGVVVIGPGDVWPDLDEHGPDGTHQVGVSWPLGGQA